jgi:hypothetical protein
MFEAGCTLPVVPVIDVDGSLRVQVTKIVARSDLTCLYRRGGSLTVEEGYATLHCMS